MRYLIHQAYDTLPHIYSHLHANKDLDVLLESSSPMSTNSKWLLVGAGGFVLVIILIYIIYKCCGSDKQFSSAVGPSGMYAYPSSGVVSSTPFENITSDLNNVDKKKMLQSVTWKLETRK